MHTAKFYAVVKGKQPGIYRSWDDTKAQVDGFKGHMHKSFYTLEEAQEYMEHYSTERSNGALLWRAAGTPLPQEEWKEEHITISKATNKGRNTTSWIMKVISYGALLVIGYLSLMYTRG